MKFKENLQRVEKTVAFDLPSLPSQLHLELEKLLFFPPVCLFLVSPLLLTHFPSHTLITKCVEDFPHTKQFSVTPAGCPIVKLNSNTLYLKIVADSTASGLNPSRLFIPHFGC